MSYQPSLDGIRALAAVLVLLFHARVPGFSAGYLGVDVFFVLSGFLITHSLIAERQHTGKIDYLNFTIRRLRRLYPALALFLLTYLSLSSLVWPDTPIEKHQWDALVASLYMSDYATAAGRPILVISHLWSLGVEEKFYLIWPIAIATLLYLPRKSAQLLIILIFIATTMWRAHNAEDTTNFWHTYFRFDTHCSGLLLGSAAAFSTVNSRPSFGWLGLAGLAVVMTLFTWKTQASATIGISLTELFSLMIVTNAPAFLGWSPLRWLGKMSYGFYLWHYLFIKIGRASGLEWQEQLLFSGIGGLVCAAVSYYALEQWLKAPNRYP